MEDRPYRLTVTLPGSTFEAEGTEESVRADYQRFLDALAAVKLKDAAATSHEVTPLTITVPGNPPVSPPAAPAWKSGVDPAVRERVYAMHGHRISLQVLPNGKDREQDAILLVLYGFRLRGPHPVSADDLIASVRQSGIPLLRVDRIIQPLMGDFVTKAGRRRGSRYGLTNRGIARAEDLLRALNV